MRIDLNGRSIETAAGTLAELIDERGFQAPSVATALDGAFVARGQRAETVLREGARVEIVAPMQGG
ncbi:sulfur carrier protein ThiS [Acidimangrovimonas pyrenivorans]|uniref:Sulfur carrier protein ThiS n=1 Tax=Acidimangrovimonas pyrenivorans TaxID=2030798 RepID=A0ABV7AHD1_9RHOB